jgi:hypothetical protein
MTLRRAALPELVDGFGKTADAEFGLDELLDFLEERVDKLNADEVYDLAASCSYLFESWRDPLVTSFVPRRMFFQGAEFRITPTREEVEGGFLLAGHRFMPFLSRDVFPADAWLVLPDGSAPHVRRVEVSSDLAMSALGFFGKAQALEYLATDDKANETRTDTVAVTVYDLRDFYDRSGFKAGDSLMVRVLDWLQGVFSVTHLSANETIDLQQARAWSVAMRDAYGQMQDELGPEGDCYEQLAVTLLLGAEDGAYPLMKHPPLSLAAFFNSQEEIVIKQLADRAVLCHAEDDPMKKMIASLSSSDDGASDLGRYFRELGLSINETEAEAYMRDAHFQGKSSPDAVLARIVAGRSLFFKTADDQDIFHDMWLELWEEVGTIYSREEDVHGALRARLLAINDRCLATMRKLDREKAFEAVLKNPAFEDFNRLTASLSGMLLLLNSVQGEVALSAEKLDAMMASLVPALEESLRRLEEG